MRELGYLQEPASPTTGAGSYCTLQKQHDLLMNTSSPAASSEKIQAADTDLAVLQVPLHRTQGHLCNGSLLLQIKLDLFKSTVFVFLFLRRAQTVALHTYSLPSKLICSRYKPSDHKGTDTSSRDKGRLSSQTPWAVFTGSTCPFFFPSHL